MLFDTDMIIWVQRGNRKAADLIDRTYERHISILTYMELLQEAQNRKQHKYIKEFIKDMEFVTLPLSEKSTTGR